MHGDLLANNTPRIWMECDRPGEQRIARTISSDCRLTFRYHLQNQYIILDIFASNQTLFVSKVKQIGTSMDVSRRGQHFAPVKTRVLFTCCFEQSVDVNNFNQELSKSVRTTFHAGVGIAAMQELLVPGSHLRKFLLKKVFVPYSNIPIFDLIRSITQEKKKTILQPKGGSRIKSPKTRRLHNHFTHTLYFHYFRNSTFCMPVGSKG